MNTHKIYDLIGIGIGPFNLGLAAMTASIKELDCLFIDKKPSFSWHPGLMLPTAKMQVPFYADLVMLADPTSPFTYMSYLKATGKLFRFAINESYFPYRSEYQDYCRWVVQQLTTLHFGQACKSISYDKTQQLYYVAVLDTATTKINVLTARHIVIGVGSLPYLPACAKNIRHPNIFHASDYLSHKHAALMHKNITLIGSGQSAAEIFQDLLPHINNLESLKWYTRSDRFYAMDYSKFSLECSTPDYIDYFYHLPAHKKPAILSGQHDLYKGINFSLIEEIYQQLYVLSLDASNKLPVLRTSCELTEVTTNEKGSFTIKMWQHDIERSFEENTDAIVLATGYQYALPSFIDSIRSLINWTDDGKYAVAENYSIDLEQKIFVQNAEQHTHGFNSADLGLGPHRNATIINAILKRDYFVLETNNVFQHFSSGSNDCLRSSDAHFG